MFDIFRHPLVSLLLLRARTKKRRKQPARRAKPETVFESLERREMLSITAGNASYNASSAAVLSVPAPGLLAYCSDSNGYQMTAHLVSGPSSLVINGDGSLTYTPAGATGMVTAEYDATDAYGNTSNIATLTLNVELGVASAADSTKVAVDTLHVGQQILNDPWADAPTTSPLPAGGSGGTVISPAPADGAPATAHNLSLVYDSVAGHPDQVLEADFALAMNPAVSPPDTLTVTATFNGSPVGTSYVSTQGLGANPTMHVAVQADTSTLPTGRYPYSLTLGGSSMYAPSTINGFANVVNDSASPFGMGWDMPGLYHLYQNNVQNVPAGVLLTMGGAQGWYFTQGAGNSYTSPNGPDAFDTLTSVTGGGWQLVDKWGTTFNFNASGLLTSRVERTGETTSYAWASGALTAITDPFGRSVDLGYNAGLLSSITDFAGSVWNFTDTGGDLTSISEPNAGGGSPVWQYAYSGNYLSSVEDPNANVTSYVLNSEHRLSGATLPGGATTSDTSEQNFGYGSSQQYNAPPATQTSTVIPSSTDPNGSTSDYQTDQFGDPISQTDPYGNVETIQRNLNGLPTQITQPPPATGDAAPVTNISYDTMGNETSATGAMPSYGTWTYNTFGEWATFTDSLGKEWLRTFDGKGDVLSESDPLGSQVSWTYDAYGRPLTMTVPAHNNGTGTETTQYFYDSDERLTKIQWPDGSTRLFAYNSDDRQTSFTNEDSATTVTNYDVLGRVTSVVNALNGTVSTTYDKDGNVLTTQDEMGNVTSDVWNARNELTQQTLPAPVSGQASPVLAWTYDANGNELTYTDALGRVTSYSWDKLDRMASETLPVPASGKDSPVTTFGYDNLSHKTSETNALSGTTTWAYANADENLVTSETLPAPSGSGAGLTTSFGFDGDGRQVTVTNAMNQTSTSALYGTHLF